jgi:hypothetical protein
LFAEVRIETREVVAHKTEVCYRCSKVIEIGERYYKTGKNHNKKNSPIFGKTQGKGFGIRHFCLQCYDEIVIDVAD